MSALTNRLKKKQLFRYCLTALDRYVVEIAAARYSMLKAT
jgi:hypothetical protein